MSSGSTSLRSTLDIQEEEVDEWGLPAVPAARRIGAADDDLAEAMAACAIAEFHPNQQVRLVGLVSRADLNDSVGRLLSTRPTTEGRLHVELPDGSIVRAKPACLTAVVLPALADELWQHVFAQLLRWQRYALCGAVSKHWRAMSWRDASLWAQLIVVTKREYHPWRSLTLRTLPPICDGSLAGSDYEERDNVVQYLFNDYLPLLPTELCRMADAAWVRTLVLADPHGETDSWRHAQHEMESMLRLVQTVCARRYPGLRALRLPLQAIEYVPGPANPRWDDFREGVDAWRLEGRAALNKVLFPWLRELPEGLEWLAFDEGEGVGTSLHEFNSWLNLDKQAPPHLPRPPCTSTASPPHPHRIPIASPPHARRRRTSRGCPTCAASATASGSPSSRATASPASGSSRGCRPAGDKGEIPQKGRGPPRPSWHTAPSAHPLAPKAPAAAASKGSVIPHGSDAAVRLTLAATIPGRSTCRRCAGGTRRASRASRSGRCTPRRSTSTSAPTTSARRAPPPLHTHTPLRTPCPCIRAAADGHSILPHSLLRLNHLQELMSELLSLLPNLRRLKWTAACQDLRPPPV